MCDTLAVMDVDRTQWQEHRSYLMAVAYRLLGTVSDAEDAVQEAYLRLRRYDGAAIRDVRRWLTAVVSRICLDELRSARVRREQYVGTWLPEPLVGADGQPGPDERAVMRESVDIAMLVVLETLTPAERVAFVLHDVFDVSFDDVGEVLGRSPTACRQLASRARTRVRRRVPRQEVSRAEHERVVGAFMAATSQGQLQDLVRVLDPDVVFRSDGGGIIPAARGTVRGREAVTQLIRGLAQRYATATVHQTMVNASGGIVMEDDGRVLAVASIRVAGGSVTAIDVVINPEKLRHVGAAQHLGGVS